MKKKTQNFIKNMSIKYLFLLYIILNNQTLIFMFMQFEFASPITIDFKCTLIILEFLVDC